jgi:hypothetical protein
MVFSSRRIRGELELKTKGTDQAVRDVQRLDAAFRKLAKEAKSATAVSQGSGQGIRDVGQGPAAGGRGVSAASALGVARQAAGVAGAGEVGGILGQLGSSIDALGPIGIATTAAAVGLSVGLDKLSKASEEARRAEELLLAARFAENEAEGDTTAAINEQIEAQQQVAELARKNQQDALDRVSELEAAGEGAGSGVLDYIKKLAGSESDLEAAKNAAQEWGDKAADAEAQIKGLTGSLDSTETAAADAAEALEKAAEAQSKAVLDQTDALGKEIKARQEASKRTRAQNRDRLKAIQEQSTILKVQIAALKASGLQTDEVVSKLQSLEKELGNLGKEANIVSKAVQQGTRADQQAAAERKRLRDQENQDRIQAIRDAARERRQQREEERQERLKEQIDFGNKIADIQYDTAKKQYDIQVQANRDQDRLLREHIQSVQQDFYQDFLGLFTQQNALAFRLQETRIGAQQGLSDAATEGYLGQQKLRGESGYQQLLGGPSGGGNQITINTGANPQDVVSVLQPILVG